MVRWDKEVLMGHTRTPTFGYATCSVPGCGRKIGRQGFAKVSHMRAHVRRGEAVESLGRDDFIGYPIYVYHDPVTGRRFR